MGEPKMPLYGYRCTQCDREVELLIRSDEIPVCPTCNSRSMERLMSLVAPPGKSHGIMKSSRAQAAREGHLSNFYRSERRR
jgi:putative FmdB family regulatory protein